MRDAGYDLTGMWRESFSRRDRRRGGDMTDVITIRHSTESDRAAIERLAQLDDRAAPGGEAVLGFVDGELRAALSLNGGGSVADPFYPTADLVELLRHAA
jgi:hypothetical protein